MTAVGIYKCTRPPDTISHSVHPLTLPPFIYPGGNTAILEELKLLLYSNTCKVHTEFRSRSGNNAQLKLSLCTLSLKCSHHVQCTMHM